ncbi:pyruvate kinase [Haemophilus haemoglobinophilus]|nr:pyruvate kinase [Canicola haemoglobinophilus]MBN6711609.1 pyruvate kinase [Canicola haemoglobinophilus]
MKSFDLEKALAGEPVRLRNGSKAYVKYIMPNEYKGDYPLRGIYIDSYSDVNITEVMWTKDSFVSAGPKHDIVGMWEEPRPRVTLTLPCPLKEPQVGMWYISSNNQDACKSGYCKGQISSFNEDDLNAGRYFATEEDANEWINAMKEARR